jgi:mannose-6-phosphate isomerase-like protein (cupin superfamily)
MKRLVPVALLGIGWVIGYVMPRSAVLAQTPAAQGPARGGGSPVQIFTIDGSKYPRALNGKGVVWTREELKAKYLDDPNAPSSDHLQWAPPYRLTIQRRRPPTNATAPVGSELHDDKTQIYIIIGGSGTVLLGGKPEADNSAGPGEHRGGPLVGAVSHHVKEGDVISIPPITWHASYADPGQTMTYLMVHIENRQTIP